MNKIGRLLRFASASPSANFGYHAIPASPRSRSEAPSCSGRGPPCRRPSPPPPLGGDPGRRNPPPPDPGGGPCANDSVTSVRVRRRVGRDREAFMSAMCSFEISLRLPQPELQPLLHPLNNTTQRSSQRLLHFNEPSTSNSKKPSPALAFPSKVWIDEMTFVTFTESRPACWGVRPTFTNSAS